MFMQDSPRLISLGEPGYGDLASAVALAALDMGVPSIIVTSSPGEPFESFDHGAIDWKKLMGTAHWMVNSSSMVSLGKSPAMAWSASMTFAELEGCRNVMVVDMPDEPEMISKTWGSIIAKMRQIHVLFFTQEASNSVSALEGIGGQNFLSEVRAKTMVPIVCGVSLDGSAVSISHSMGDFEIDIASHQSGISWLSGFLKSLPSSGTGISGIKVAASW